MKIRNEWFTLQKDQMSGPFDYFEMVEMLQRKDLFEHDLIWHKDFKTWHKVSETDDFQIKAIEELKKRRVPGIKNVLFRRKYPRVFHKVTAVVIDESHRWGGETVDISRGGASLILDNDELQVGRNVTLDLYPGSELPGFSAACKIRAKEPVSKRGFRYRFEFTSILPSETIQKALENFVEKKFKKSS